MATRPLRYLLRPEAISLVLDRHHICHEGFAQELNLSRQYWSQIFNRHRPLSPKVRAALIGNERLKGIPECDLWDVAPISCASAATAA